MNAVENDENVRLETDDRQQGQERQEHGQRYGNHCGGHGVQRRFVHYDNHHHRMGVHIFVHSVLLCVHAVAHVKPTYSHAIQVSLRPMDVLLVLFVHCWTLL